MKDIKTLRKVAAYLFAACLVFLLLHILIDKLNKNNNSSNSKEEIFKAEIDSLFFRSLKNYGINDELITKKKIKGTKNDSNYVVKVYQDIPIPLLLLELQNHFHKKNVEIISSEESIGGKTNYQILTDGTSQLKAEFIYQKDLFREKGRISFVVFDFPKNESDAIEILKTPEPFVVLLTPSASSVKFISTLQENSKRYAVLIGDDITELDYKLDAGYSDKRIKSSIRQIFSDFSNSAFIVIDNESDIFSSSKSELIKNEFAKRKIFQNNKSSFKLISSLAGDVQSSFDEVLKNLDKGNSEIILVSYKDFKSLLPLVPQFRKIGYRFVSPVDLLIENESSVKL